MRETVTRILPNDAASYIGCGYDKLMQLVRLNKIPNYRIGRRVLFTKESLDAWIENQVNKSIV